MRARQYLEEGIALTEELGDLALQTVGEPAATILKMAVRGAPLRRFDQNEPG